MNKKALIEKALEARKRAYMPYSGFAVGAALLCAGGSVYLGCNIENAAFTPGNCAERTAIFKAVSEGETDFMAVAVVGARIDGSAPDGALCAPCGVCRQVMREFCDPEKFEIILAPLNNLSAFKVFTLEQLLPESFGPGNLAKG